MPYPNVTMAEVERAQAFERGIRPKVEKLIGQYQRGLITAGELSEEILEEYIKHDM